MEGDNAIRPGGVISTAPSSGPMPEQVTSYTVPGILHFIKHEWSRFEKERASWEVEKAELQAKIAFLQGERKGHDNLVRDLVRRIKMLEFALKQERSKLYKLQHGTELPFEMKAPGNESENSNTPLDLTMVANQKEESRKILREYLREVGFPDNVLEARVARITAYKNLHSQNQAEQSSSRSESPKPVAQLPPPSTKPPIMVPPPLANGPIANGTDTQAQPQSLSTPKQREASPPRLLDPTKPAMEEGLPEVEGPSEGIMAEDRALASFNFLDEEDSDDEEEGGEWEDQTTQELLQGIDAQSSSALSDSSMDMDTESAMDEFTSNYTESSSSGMESGSEIVAPEQLQGRNQDDWKADYTRKVQEYAQHRHKNRPNVAARPSRSELQRMEQFKNEAEEQPPSRTPANQPFGLGGLGMMSHLPGRGRNVDPKGIALSPLSPRRGVSDERIEVSYLGDLAKLSISNEAVGGFENPTTEAVKKWENKYAMRSHFDAVTCVAFHPSDHILVTGSEDCTIKIWSLQRTSAARRSVLVDVEAIQTLRGHRGAVLCVMVGTDGELCYSGGTDNVIRVWKFPSDSVDPFDLYESNIHHGILEGHTDSVWDLAVHSSSGSLLSCSADGTCRLWNRQLSEAKCFQAETGYGNPTSVDFLATDLHQMVASYSAAKTVIYDLETATPVVNLDSASTYDGTRNTQINKAVCHPTLPIIVTAHEDKYIRFFDANTGKVIHSMTAHMDAVTGLAVDPHGLYLLSGSHDGSLRFWNMDTKICIQETTSHRKRYDEAIYNVACHLTKPYFASAGADGVAKVFI